MQIHPNYAHLDITFTRRMNLKARVEKNTPDQLKERVSVVSRGSK